MPEMTNITELYGLCTINSQFLLAFSNNQQVYLCSDLLGWPLYWYGWRSYLLSRCACPYGKPHFRIFFSVESVESCCLFCAKYNKEHDLYTLFFCQLVIWSFSTTVFKQNRFEWAEKNSPCKSKYFSTRSLRQLAANVFNVFSTVENSLGGWQSKLLDSLPHFNRIKLTNIWVLM